MKKMNNERVAVIIPESILVTIVFPKIIEAFITVGPGKCYKGLRNSGCDMCHISTRVCGMLMRCLPRCGEPFCNNLAIHRCEGAGQPICCVHAARFGYMHQKTSNNSCLCRYRKHYKINKNPVDKWNRNGSVNIKEYNQTLFVSYWRRGELHKQYNLTDGKIRKEVWGILTKENLLQEDPQIYIFLLYYYHKEVDRHIFKLKNPNLAKNWKKLKYEEEF